MGDRRLEDLHHECGHRHHVLRHDHGRHRRRRDLESDRSERDARLLDLRPDAEARLARLRHARARLPGGASARGKPARPPWGGLPAVPPDPRRRADLRGRDGGGPGAGMLRPRVSVCAGAGAVREADRAVPVGLREAGRHGDRDRSGAPARLQGSVGEGPRPAVRAHGGDGEALLGGAVAPRCQLRPADPRRLRVHGRIPDLAPLPRPEDPRDRGGNERSAADGDREAPWACSAPPQGCYAREPCSSSGNSWTRIWAAPRT